MHGAATQAMLFHRRGAATQQMPAPSSLMVTQNRPGLMAPCILTVNVRLSSTKPLVSIMPDYSQGRNPFRRARTMADWIDPGIQGNTDL
jgi:hypothetical protein